MDELRLSGLDLLQLGRLPRCLERDGTEIGHSAQPCDCGGIDGKRARCAEMQGAERPLRRTQAEAQGRAGIWCGADDFCGGEAFRKRLLIERAFGEGNGWGQRTVGGATAAGQRQALRRRVEQPHRRRVAIHRSHRRDEK